MSPEERTALEAEVNKRKRILEEKREALKQLNARLGIQTTDQKSATDAQELLRRAIDRATEAAEDARHQEEIKAEAAPKAQAETTIIAPPTEEVYVFEKAIQTDVVETETEPPAEVEEPSSVPQPVTPETAEVKAQEAPTVDEGPAIVVTSADEEYRDLIMKSSNFEKFIDRACTVIEKAMNLENVVNIFQNYIGDEAADLTGPGNKLGDQIIYEDSKFTSKRCLTSLATSQRVCRYTRRKDGVYPDGVVLLWSAESPNRPEQALVSQSAVTCAAFSPTSPYLIFGGTSTGSLLLWDMRASNKPVQSTRLSSSQHQTQIQAIHTTSLGSTTVLLSLDEENRGCVWTVDMTLTHVWGDDLKGSSEPESSRKIFNFGSALKNQTLYAGTEDGRIYTATLTGSDVKNFKVHGEIPTSPSPIFSVDVSPDSSLPGNLLLTTSSDWIVRLWDASEDSVSLLHEFENTLDYTFHAKWSSSRPSVFASGDAKGVVSLYDLNTSLHTPVGEAKTTGSISKLEFMLEGKRLLAGTSTGQIHSMAISSDASSYKGELSLFESFVEELRTKHPDAQ